jgi:hypothetical protein
MGHRSFTARLVKLERAQPALPVVFAWLEHDGDDVGNACATALRNLGLPPGTAARFVVVCWQTDGRTEQSAL